MSVSFLGERLYHLASIQNPDGGWGYKAGGSSWLEPTCYTMLVLHGQKAYRGQWERAWTLIRNWQMSDGGCRPTGQVNRSNWTTALWTTLHAVAGIRDAKAEAALNWLLDRKGAEGALWRRIVESTKPRTEGYNTQLFGWPWFPDTNSWIEPSVHAVVALKRMYWVAPGRKHPRHTDIKLRARLGEQMILDRRCVDGGWNYGARLALGIALESYPESTGVALLGLQGNKALAVRNGLAVAHKQLPETRSPLARAWLELSLRLHGMPAPEPKPGHEPPKDILVAALQALGCPDGNHALLRTPELDG